jgi:hypothetical protein
MSDSDAKEADGPPTPDERGGERRTDERHFACFPAHIQRPGGSTRMALIRDLSVSGAQLLTRARLTAGDAVELSLYLADDMDKVRRVSARVVRAEPRAGERAEVWHYTAAVQFDEPIEDCAAEIREIAARQAELGVPRD